MEIINVVAAIITKENFYLIAQRNRNKHLGLQWEFPGGKVNHNEKFQDALMREIMEELSIKINIQKKITEKNYKDKKIDAIIHYFFCTLGEGIIKLTEHEDFLWVEKKNLYKFNLVPGDKKVLSLL